MDPTVNVVNQMATQFAHVWTIILELHHHVVQNVLLVRNVLKTVLVYNKNALILVLEHVVIKPDVKWLITTPFALVQWVCQAIHLLNVLLPRKHLEILKILVFLHLVDQIHYVVKLVDKQLVPVKQIMLVDHQIADQNVQTMMNVLIIYPVKMRNVLILAQALVDQMLYVRSYNIMLYALVQMVMKVIQFPAANL